ncbi:MAG TPA: AMP-binding protein [Candidatus Dormibacteraeota bacterium]
MSVAVANLDAAVLSRVVEAEAQRDPGRLLLVFEDGGPAVERVTAGQLAVRGAGLAGLLHHAGLRRGDRVAVMTGNHPEFVYALVANARLALPTVPIDPDTRGDRLAHCLRFAGCAALVAADTVVADERVAATIRAGGLRTWVASTPEGRALGLDPARDWPLVDEAVEVPGAPAVAEQVTDLAEPWLLVYGAGAEPDAVEIAHERLLLYRRLPELLGYRSTDVPYTGLSLTRGNALITTVLPAIWGVVAHTVISRRVSPARLWDVCIAHGVTTWTNLGELATAVYSEPSSPRDRGHSVRLVVSAGMPREIWHPFEERFGVKVLEWYGSMEGGFACNPVGVGPVGSFGKPPDGLLEMEVVDGDGRPVAAGQVGELVLRPVGGRARLRYWRNPAAAARRLRDGWLRTGDMVARDAEGWLYLAHPPDPDGLRRVADPIGEVPPGDDAEQPDVHVYGIP